MDYYKYKKQSMAQDIEEGEKERIKKEKEQKDQQDKDKMEFGGDSSSSSQSLSEQPSGDQPDTTSQIPKSAIDEENASNDPDKKPFHSISLE